MTQAGPFDLVPGIHCAGHIVLIGRKHGNGNHMNMMYRPSSKCVLFLVLLMLPSVQSASATNGIEPIGVSMEARMRGGADVAVGDSALSQIDNPATLSLQPRDVMTFDFAGQVIFPNCEWTGPIDKYKRRDNRHRFLDQLFDRKRDPLELTNLIDKPNYAKVQNQLKEHFNDFKSRVPATGKMELINETKINKGFCSFGLIYKTFQLSFYS